MNLNASIIDQRLAGVKTEIEEWAKDELNITTAERLKPLAFVYLYVKTTLDLDARETFDCITDGSGDFGVDAMQVAEAMDGEFHVTLFQAKYTHKLDANANFPEQGIHALVNAIRHIFDPTAELGTINERLRVKVEDARAMVRDGLMPRVHRPIPAKRHWPHIKCPKPPELSYGQTTCGKKRGSVFSESDARCNTSSGQPIRLSRNTHTATFGHIQKG